MWIFSNRRFFLNKHRVSHKFLSTHSMILSVLPLIKLLLLFITKEKKNWSHTVINYHEQTLGLPITLSRNIRGASGHRVQDEIKAWRTTGGPQCPILTVSFCCQRLTEVHFAGDAPCLEGCQTLPGPGGFCCSALEGWVNTNWLEGDIVSLGVYHLCKPRPGWLHPGALLTARLWENTYFCTTPGKKGIQLIETSMWKHTAQCLWRLVSLFFKHLDFFQV